MRHIFTGLLTLLMLGIATQNVDALTQEQRNSIINDFRRQLPGATVDDSIRLLYNIYDLTNVSISMPVAAELFDVARRNGRESVMLDILRQQTNSFSKNGRGLDSLLQIGRSLPASPEQAETVLFLRMRVALYDYYRAKPVEREERLHLLTQKYLEEADSALNLDDKILLLYTLSTYLTGNVTSSKLAEYNARLKNALEELPCGLLAIRSLYYTQAANCYTNSSDPQRAVEADRELLKIMDEYEKEYGLQGRNHRDYSAHRYICYRRMLSNYEALTPDEVESVYAAIKELAKADPSKQGKIDNRVEVSYQLARKDYRKAMRILRNNDVMELSGDNLPTRRHLLGALMDAATEQRDTVAMLKVALAYNQVLKDYESQVSNDKIRELQVQYDFNELRKEKNRIENEQLEQQYRRNRVMLIVALVVASLLLLLTIGLWRHYRRSKTLAADLTMRNDELATESLALRLARDELSNARDESRRANSLKAEFIQNVSHEIGMPLDAIVGYSQLVADYAAADNGSYIDRFADIIRHNAELLQTMVSDILNISDIENGEIEFSKRATSLRRICDVCVANVERNLVPGVAMRYDSEAVPDRMINTDRIRVEQVLSNLLGNAAKFTEKGFVSLECKVTDTHVRFIVTDSGPGIPAERVNDVFRSFVKLNSTVPGAGLGLYISRLIAEKFEGSLTYEPAPEGTGSRFIFTLPL